jgi:hypothetical protein
VVIPAEPVVAEAEPVAPEQVTPAADAPVSISAAVSEPVEARAHVDTPEPRAHIPSQRRSPAIARRVRGAQLPDTGDSAVASVGPNRDAAVVGRQLSGLQSSVARARRDARARKSDPSALDSTGTN